MEFRTCTFIHDDGNLCNSAAVTDRNLCFYHLDHRARLMRMAQYRARGQRFDLQSRRSNPCTPCKSALTQLSEALAADMIELKRADRLIRVLNIASRNLLKADKWPASPYHSDQPAPAVDLAATYGLPNDLDLMGAPTMGGLQLPDVGNYGEGSHAGTRSRVPHPCRRSLATGWEPLATGDRRLATLTPPCRLPATVASTATTAPTWSFALTIPSPPNTSSSSRFLKLRASMLPPAAAVNWNATAGSANSATTASATPPSPWKRTCASPPKNWPNRNSPPSAQPRPLLPPGAPFKDAKRPWAGVPLTPAPPLKSPSLPPLATLPRKRRPPPPDLAPARTPLSVQEFELRVMRTESQIAGGKVCFQTPRPARTGHPSRRTRAARGGICVSRARKRADTATLGIPEPARRVPHQLWAALTPTPTIG